MSNTNLVKISVIPLEDNIDHIYTRYKKIRRIYIIDIKRHKTLARIDIIPKEGEA